MEFIECADERGAYLRVVCSNGEFLIDIEDRALIGDKRWCLYKFNQHNHYPGRCEGKTTVLLHRQIMRAPKGIKVDHRDGNGCNCRRYNLRIATRHQNNMNKRITKGTASGYRGVYKSGNRFNVIVSRDHKAIYLGCFVDPVEAAKVRDAWVLAEYGEFAVLNFPAK